MTGTLEPVRRHRSRRGAAARSDRVSHRHLPGVRADTRGRRGWTSTASATLALASHRAALSAAHRHGRRSGGGSRTACGPPTSISSRGMPGLEAIDVVATEALLDSGYYQRLHESVLPGIEDARLPAFMEPLPVLLVPEAESPARRPLIGRGRSSAAIAKRSWRSLRAWRPKRAPRGARRWGARRSSSSGRCRTSIWRGRCSATRRCRTRRSTRCRWRRNRSPPRSISLFSAIAAGFTRGALVELLRSPHSRVRGGRVGELTSRGRARARSTTSSSAKYLGGARLAPSPIGAARPCGRSTAADGAAAARGAARADGAGADRRHPRRSSRRTSGCRTPSDAVARAAHARARRGPVRAADAPSTRMRHTIPSALSISELSGAVRRWIEGQTFSPRTRRRRRPAARRRVPLPTRTSTSSGSSASSRADWPERSARSIFYPQSLLAPARLAGRAGSLAGRARALPGSAAPAAPPGVALHVHARRRRDRVAVAAARRRRTRWGCRSSGWCGRMPRVGRCWSMSVLMHEASPAKPRRGRSVPGRRATGCRCGSSRTFDAPRFRGHDGSARSLDLRGQPCSSATWSARSSTSPRTSSACRKNATRKPG